MDMMNLEIDKEDMIPKSKYNKKNDVKKFVQAAIIKLQVCEYDLNLMKAFKEIHVPEPVGHESAIGYIDETIVPSEV